MKNIDAIDRSESTQSLAKERKAFLEGLNDDFEVLRQNTDEWNDELAERELWGI